MVALLLLLPLLVLMLYGCNWGRGIQYLDAWPSAG